MPRVPASWAFIAATWALVGGLHVHASVHLDTARDLLIARDCVEGLGCGLGAPSSFGGWMHGALWSHLLELRMALGLGFVTLERVTHAMLALAAGLVPVTARMVNRPATGFTWALWLAATLWLVDHPTLWSPTVWPLALGLVHAAFFKAVATRGWWWWLAVGAALAAATDVHVASGLLLPFVVAGMFGCAARPVLAAVGMMAAFVAVMGVVSPGTAAVNWGQVRGVAPVGVGALAMAVGVLMRGRLAALADAARVRAVAWALCGGFGLLLPLLALGSGHPLSGRYFAPVVVPAAILLGAAVRRRWLRGAAVVVVVAGYGAYWAEDRWVNGRFRLVEVPALADALYADGRSFAELHGHLRGPQAFDLLATLAAFEPGGRRSDEEDRDVLVVRARRAAVPVRTPAGWAVVELGDAVAVVVTYTPAVRLAGLEVCAGTCGAAVSRAARRAERAYAGLAGLPRIATGERVTYRFPVVEIPGRRVQLLRDECKGWRLGDGTRSTLLAGAGQIEFSVIAGPRCRWWIPPFVELPADDAALAELLTRFTP